MNAPSGRPSGPNPLTAALMDLIELARAASETPRVAVTVIAERNEVSTMNAGRVPGLSNSEFPTMVMQLETARSTAPAFR